MMLFPVLVSLAFIVSSIPLNYRVALCDKMCLFYFSGKMTTITLFLLEVVS